MATSFDNFTCYIPIHTNYAQMENIAVFLQHMQGKLFIYEWNTEADKMSKEFADKSRWPNAEVYTFTEREVFQQLERDEQAGRHVVVILTASTNYPFARSQLRFFRLMQKQFPSTVIDVLPLGHCMYGCDSCSVKEHQIPLFFTRFFTKTLPYTAQDLSSKYDLTSARAAGKKIILVSPSVYAKSFLTQRPFIDALIKLQTNESDRFKFLVKLHGYCFFTYKEESGGTVTSHPLHSLSDIERENIQLLKDNFATADETEYNVLPFIEAADAVITDLDSSVAFEALYFHAAIYAYDYRQETDSDLDEDAEKKEYHSYLHLFKTVDQMSSLLHSNLKPKHEVKGRQFFEKKYGQVNGNEMSRIADSRGWFVPPAEATTGNNGDRWNAVQTAINEEFSEESSTPLDYMARGCEIPTNVLDFTLFLQAHQQQLQDMRVPETLWRKLHSKVKNEIFDSGKYFQFAMDEDGNMLLMLNDELEEGLAVASDIFLVDHFWTSTLENMRNQLRTVPNLLERMMAIVGVNPEDNQDKEELVEAVWSAMWKYNQTYRVRLNEEDKEGTPVWYMMDELGSRVSHCDTPQEDKQASNDEEEEDEPAHPNTRCIPFFYNARGVSYSVMWPVMDLEPGDIITRDFLEGVKGTLQRAARGVAFGIDEGEDNAELFQNALERHRSYVKSVVPPSRPSPQQVPGQSASTTDLKVFSDTEFIRKALTWDRFSVVEEAKDADILWFSDDVGNIQDFLNDKRQLVNQYPNEMCVTYKHKLVETALRCWGETCTWLPTTYNLNTQLPQFIAHWREIEEEKENSGDKVDNLWIVKPWNKSRGLEIFVTDSLAPIIRSIETGPKIASKYLSRPALFKGRKFDLRYIIMVRSLEPLEIYAYRMFWIRAANKPFSLDHFDDYEKHFTVMNYSTFKLEQILYTDFIKTFESEHPSVQWADVQQKIYQMFRDVFVAAVQPSTDKWTGLLRPINQDASLDLRGQCRGMYGADLMIDESMNPVLLEMNFSPDCKRAVNYDPDFFNVVFTTMFTDDWKEDASRRDLIMSKVALI